MGAAAIKVASRRRSARLLLLAVAYGALIPLTMAVASRASEPSLVVIGDSVSAGYGASDAAHGWTALLGVPVQGAAAPGAPSAFFVGQSWSGGTVVVELGINDSRLGVPPAVYGDHMRRILADITASRVVVIVPYRTGAEATGAWDAYADQLLAIARRDPRVVLVDLRPAFGTPSIALLAPDLVHPNDRGHALIARLVSQAFAG